MKTIVNPIADVGLSKKKDVRYVKPAKAGPEKTTSEGDERWVLAMVLEHLSFLLLAPLILAPHSNLT